MISPEKVYGPVPDPEITPEVWGWVHSQFTRPTTDKSFYTFVALIETRHRPELLTLRAERDEAREALKPFAEFIAADTNDRMPPDMPLTVGSPMARRQITVRQFRAARDALRSTLSPEDSLDPKAAQLEDGAAELSSIIVDVRAGRFTNHAALADRLVAIVDRNRAALAALPQAEPGGWVLVPRKLTVAMEQAEYDASQASASAQEVWSAMLFASPTPAVSREVTEEMVETAMVAFIAAVREQDREWTDEVDEEQLLVSPLGDYFAPFFPLRAALTAALSQPHSEK